MGESSKPSKKQCPFGYQGVFDRRELYVLLSKRQFAVLSSTLCHFDLIVFFQNI
jgi:hypothetical protein